MKIGIPQGMLYEKYGYAWQTFFKTLGIETVLSPTTNKSILNKGLEKAENELCLPIKAYFGHVLKLSEEIDTIFVPRISSIKKEGYTCPKLLGLPDMIENTIKDLTLRKFNIIAPRVDNKEKVFWKDFYLELGKLLGFEKQKIDKAAIEADQAQKKYHRMLQDGFLPEEIFSGQPKQKKDSCDLTIGIVGHSYLLYDSYLSMNLIKRLRRLGEKDIYIITPEMISGKQKREALSSLPKPLFWNYQEDIFNAVYVLSKTKAVDGIIYVSAFPCGPDSVMGEYIAKEAKKNGIPFTSITMDEQTGSAGVETRIEAFTDMIIRRKRQGIMPRFKINPETGKPQKIKKIKKKDMVVSFPRMGEDTHLALKHFFNKIGIRSIPAPPTTEKTLRLGIKYGPETICLPLKLNIGNYIEALENGANILLHAGGCGPCRFGFYGNLAETILKEELGYDFEFKVLEPPGSQGLQRFADFFRFFSPGILSKYVLPITKRTVQKIHQLTGRKQVEILATTLHDLTLWNLIKEAYYKKQAFDFIEKRSLEVRCYEKNAGDTTRALAKAREFIDKAKDLDEIEEAKIEGLRLFSQVNIDPKRDVLRIGLAGEFFILLEPFINFNIEKWLGEKGVFVEKGVYTSDWIAPGRKNVVGGISYEKLVENAYPYLKYRVGGEGIATVGHTVLCAKHGFDGVIHMMPFTCMPETVAKQILPHISHEQNIPVLSLVIDEQTGKAGVETRLEAFIDLMRNRRGLVKSEVG